MEAYYKFGMSIVFCISTVLWWGVWPKFCTKLNIKKWASVFLFGWFTISSFIFFISGCSAVVALINFGLAVITLIISKKL